MSKVAAQWVPRILMEDNKQRGVEYSREFLNGYVTHSDVF